MTQRYSPDFKRLWYPILLLLVGTLAYSNTFQSPFLFDGLYHIANNMGIRDLTNLRAVFFSGYQETRPVFVFSLALCYHFVGTDVWLYHLVNLLLHLGCGLLLYQLTQTLLETPQTAESLTPQTAESLTPQTTESPTLQTAESLTPQSMKSSVSLEESITHHSSRRGVPEFVAALFVLHPLATESVSYINSRSGVLMAFFGLLSLRSYLRFLTLEGRVRAFSYGLSLLFMLLAIGSKESAVMLPLLFGITVWLCRRDLLTSRRWWLTLLPHTVCLLVLPLLYSFVTNPHPPNPYTTMFPWWSHIMTQVRVLGWFLLLSVVPLYHNFDYDFPFSTTLIDGSFFLSLGGWLILLVVAWRLRRQLPLLLLGLLWFGLSLAPTNSMTLKDFVAERYLYTSLLGAAWSLGGLFSLSQRYLKTQILRQAGVAFLLGTLLLWGGLTFARNDTLGDPLALWQHTAKRSPNKSRPQLNLGIYFMNKGKFRKAYQSLERALRLDPKDPEVHYNLGVFFDKVRSAPQAVNAYKKAYQILPSSRNKQALVRSHNRAGRWFFWRRDLKHATSHFRSAIALDPMYYIAHFNLAVAYVQMQQWKQARHHFEMVRQLHPLHPKVGMWLKRLKQKTKE